ncbi:UNVERIFIED_CONTAM: putative late blight resistance proteinR1A-10 [Sesamum radiatum]|uniref:Late blight resistance proteinR1A-10 n=1 Tax=Sesamum radiatum TaxID=300843 RepID=A0AAW2WI35_SESRA
MQQDNVVGFEDEAEKLIGYLLQETQELDVVSIIGMPGLGKTTLAGKIFRDPVIKDKFPVRIWVYISQEFKMKDVFLAILRQFIRIDEDMYCKSDQELAQLVASNLEREKFLIVMDDIWTGEDWYRLETALPKSTKRGKVLITSRQVEVAQYANRNRIPHHLRLLTQDESWLLLQYEVFKKSECPPELEFLGKLIAEQCCGLPLAIVVIGVVLTIKFRAWGHMSRNVHAWTKVSENISTYLNDDPDRCMEKTIALSYDKLPYHLRACFLYLGMFPEDFEIPVQKLLRMWIAEGFVQRKVDIGLEELAENYLEELINRNLLRVDKRRSDGGVKTCRIHNMLRNFCKNEARSKKENFFQEVKMYDGEFEPSVTILENFRRLCIHSDVSKFLSSQPTVLECQLRGLPPSFKFPPKLKSLTLSYTFLDWGHISILGMLENLEVLKLKDNAFMGDCWEIGHTNLVTWVALGHHFPELRCLELHNCDELREIPIGLADAPYFRALDLCHSKLAVASAKKIQKAKEKKKEDHNDEFNYGFKLSIFPPEE